MFAISSEFIRSMMSVSSGLLSFMWFTTAYITTSDAEASILPHSLRCPVPVKQSC